MTIEKYKFEWKVGLIFLILCLGFITWYSGMLNGGKLTKNDVEQYLTQIDKNLNWPEEVKQPMLQRLRSWGEADDGKQFFMLNMMRFRDQVYQYPGAIKGFSETGSDSAMPFTSIWADYSSTRKESEFESPTTIGEGPLFIAWRRSLIGKA